MILVKYLIGTFCVLMIVGLHLHGKLAQHKDKMDPKYQGWYNTFEKVYGPILGFFKGMIAPVKVGNGLFIEMDSVIVLIIFLAVLLVL